MKNNLFRNFTALLLSGTMLAGVGCKDYDDDIDNLQKEIDGLKGEIALKADASALKSLQEKIDGIDFSKFLTASDLANYVTEDKLGTELADLLKSNDFNSKVEEIVKAQGYKTQAEIEAIVSQMMLDKEDVAAIFQEQMAAGETWQSLLPKVQEAITAELGKFELTEAQVQQVTSAVLAALGEQMDEEKVSEIVAGILGDDLGTYLMNYFVENQEMLIGAMTSVLVGQLGDAKSELHNSILALIQENLGENVTYLKENKLLDVFKAYDAKITEIWSAIDDLSGRIQSIVFVPTAMNQEFDVNLGGYYIAAKDGDATRIELAANPKVKIAFRVAPATLAEALAKKINDGTVTAKFIPEKITRADQEPLTYENGSVTWDDGKIIFTAVADEEIYGALKANEAYAVALSLSQKSTMGDEKVEKEDQTYGFEITSPYFTTNGGSKNVRDNFVLALLDDEGEPVSAYDPAKGVAYDLVWNDMNTVITLLDRYGLAYKEGDKLLSMKKAAEAYLWDTDVALSFVATHTNIEYTTGYKSQKQLTVDPKDPTAKGNENETVTVRNSSAASIAEVGNVLKLTDKASISNGSTKIAMAQEEVYSTVTILGDLLKTMNINLDFKWSYSKYTAGAYEAEITIPASDQVNWEKFNQLPEKGFTVKLALPQGSKIVTNGSDIELTFIRKEMLNEESAQQFVVTMKNYLTGDGKISYEEDVHLLAENEIDKIETYVKFKGTVSFEGLPDMTYAVSNEGASVDADYKVTLSTNLNKQLYAQVGSYFADENEVAKFISALTLDYSKVAQTAKLDAAPIVLGVTPEINQGTLTIAFDSEGIDWQKQPSYVYNVPQNGYIAGTNSDGKVVFKLNMTGSYTLTNTIYSLQPNPSYLKTDGSTQYMDLDGTISGTEFTLKDIILGNAYLVSDEATEAGATLSFRLAIDKEDLPGYGDNTLPAITGNNMEWNGCILNTVPVVAELKNSRGELLDSKEFEVRVNVPIQFSEWKAFYTGAKVEVSSSKEGTLNLINSVLALTSDGKTPSTSNPAVAIDTKGAALFALNGSDYALTGLAAAATGYGVEIEFAEEVEWTDIETEGMISGVKIDPETGVLTVPQSNETLAHNVTATVKVTFTYNYDWEPVEKAGTVTGYQKKAHVFEIPVTFTAAN